MTKTDNQEPTTANHLPALVPTWGLPADPSWDRARGYCQGIRRCVEDIIALGLELTALRNQMMVQGIGGGRYSNSYKNVNFGGGAAEVKNDRPRGSRETDEQYIEKGWQATVKEELGIGHQTALELMKRARYCCMIRDISVGEDVKYLDSKNEVHEVSAAPELQELAQHALADIANGCASPARAWAGITGEGSRRKSNVVSKRDEIDHYDNLLTGLKKLRTSLRHWRNLQPGQRAELECLWGEVAAKLPDTWRG